MVAIPYYCNFVSGCFCVLSLLFSVFVEAWNGALSRELLYTYYRWYIGSEKRRWLDGGLGPGLSGFC